MRHSVIPKKIEAFFSFFFSGCTPVLHFAANAFVPKCHKGFFKFWWDEELSLLKQASAESYRIRKAAGKPRQDPISFT